MHNAHLNFDDLFMCIETELYSGSPEKQKGSRKCKPFSGIVFFLRRQAHIESGKARYIEFARLKEAGKYIEQRSCISLRRKAALLFMN